MNGTTTRLAASIIEDRHREAAVARRAATIDAEPSDRQSLLRRLAGVRAFLARADRPMSLRVADLWTDN